MTEQVKLERRKKITKIILVTVTVLFIFVMLVVPLFSVMASALKEGFGFYLKAISTSYVFSTQGDFDCNSFCGSYQHLLWNMDSVAVDQVFV